jgi:hypothetical protein
VDFLVLKSRSFPPYYEGYPLVTPKSPYMMASLGFFLSFAIAAMLSLVHAEPAPGDIVCRLNGTTSANVNYYTCTELANRFGITIETFFILNPSVDKDCETIKPKTKYCVAGCKCAKVL